VSKKIEDPSKYWREHRNIKRYQEDLKGKTKKLVKLVTPFLLEDSNTKEKEKVSGKLHEFGCCVCRNLVRLKEEFPRLRMSGNDINKAALNYNRIVNRQVHVVDMSTDLYLKQMEPVTYILTMAHLMHLPPEMDKILLEYIPKSFTKFFFCVEQDLKVGRIKVSKRRGDRRGGNKYGRGKYEEFFSSLQVIKRVRFDQISPKYSFLVFAHK